jgi:hypothetical protein
MERVFGYDDRWFKRRGIQAKFTGMAGRRVLWWPTWTWTWFNTRRYIEPSAKASVRQVFDESWPLVSRMKGLWISKCAAEERHQTSYRDPLQSHHDRVWWRALKAFSLAKSSLIGFKADRVVDKLASLSIVANLRDSFRVMKLGLIHHKTYFVFAYHSRHVAQPSRKKYGASWQKARCKVNWR